MTVLCRMGVHRPGKPAIWNNGFYFSACAGCGRDLIRGAHNRWGPVPRGMKVVWRPRPEGYPDWSGVESAEETALPLIARPLSIDPASSAGLSSMLGGCGRPGQSR